MAESIRVSAPGVFSYDAKNAASAIEQAVKYLQQVKLDIDFKDSFSGLSMFPNTQGELRAVLDTLEGKSETIDLLVAALSNGMQKIEEADAEFKHDLVAETSSEKLGEIITRVLYGATIGNSSLLGAYWLYSSFSSNKNIDKINKTWDESPDEFKEVLKNVLKKRYEDDGGVAYSSIDLFLDVKSGECDWDTLETFLKVVKVDKTKASAVVKTLEMVYAPEGTMKSLMVESDTYQDEAVDAFIDGEIGEGLLLCGKSIGSGLGAIGYGVGEVFTELASDAVEDVLDNVTLPVRFVRHFIPGKAGEAIYNFGDKLDAGVDKIADWFSNLL